MQPELKLPEDSVVRPKGLWSRGQSVSTDEASGAGASSDGSAAETEAQDASVCACPQDLVHGRPRGWLVEVKEEKRLGPEKKKLKSEWRETGEGVGWEVSGTGVLC